MGTDTTTAKHPLLKPFGDSFEGKIVLVTGANRGIGKAFVESFLDHGAAKVYAACRSVESARVAFAGKLEGENEKAGGFVVPLHLDLVDPEAIKSIASIAADVEVVINNGAVMTRTTPLQGETTVSNLQHEMEVNVYGFVRLANAFAPLLEKRSGRGVFVQVNSVASMRCPNISMSTYGASKAAAFSITQALRDEMGQKGVHVVSVHPGPIDTDMISDFPIKKTAASTVAESLVGTIASADSNPPFLVYPDDMAKGVGRAYESFAEVMIEQGKVYGDP